MLLPKTTKINKDGHLEIGGCDVVALANEFGTPLFIYDEATIRNRCREFKESFQDIDVNIEIIYAGKAFICLSICKIMKEEGISIDVASDGELHIAKKAGISGSKIYLHGNNKSTEEIGSALDHQVGHIVADSSIELERIEDLAKKRDTKAPVLLRVTPGVTPKTHFYIQTGQIDSKFGFGINGGIALEAVKKSLGCNSIELKGFHFHIGSQIFDLKFFQQAVEVVMDFISDVKKETGFEAKELDVGGGMGIKYRETDEPPTVKDYAEMIIGTVKDRCASLGLKIPKVMIEPGRSIIGNSCITAYKVGTIKEIPQIRKYISVDGGMSDNIRPMLYGAEYEAFIANKADQKKEEKVTISGKHCESGDILAKDVMIQKPEIDDILCMPATGAYGYVMASNYNKITRPTVLLVKEGNAKTIIRRETLEDLLYLEETGD